MRQVILNKYEMVHLLREGATLGQNPPKGCFADNSSLKKTGPALVCAQEHALSLFGEAEFLVDFCCH